MNGTKAGLTYDLDKASMIFLVGGGCFRFDSNAKHVTLTCVNGLYVVTATNSRLIGMRYEFTAVCFAKRLVRQIIKKGGIA